MYAFAQKKKDKDKEKTENVKLYQGTTIGVEIAGLGNYVLGSDALSSEVTLQALWRTNTGTILISRCQYYGTLD